MRPPSCGRCRSRAGRGPLGGKRPSRIEVFESLSVPHDDDAARATRDDDQDEEEEEATCGFAMMMIRWDGL